MPRPVACDLAHGAIEFMWLPLTGNAARYDVDGQEGLYLLVPRSGRHPSANVIWSVVAQVMSEELQRQAGADVLYRALMQQLLNPVLQLPDASWANARWVSAFQVERVDSVDRVERASLERTQARLSVGCAGSVGTDLILFGTAAGVSALLSTWQLDNGVLHDQRQNGFLSTPDSSWMQCSSGRLARLRPWLPAARLHLALPCAHMGTRDLHRIRNGFLIRLAQSTGQGESARAMGLARLVPGLSQTGWRPAVWPVCLVWQGADTGDQFHMTWSKPMQDIDASFLSDPDSPRQAPVGAADLPSPQSRLSVVLECVLGTQTCQLEDLVHMQAGQLLALSEWNWPVVSIRLSGRELGTGELVMCGEELAVQITRWHPTESIDEQPV